MDSDLYQWEATCKLESWWSRTCKLQVALAGPIGSPQLACHIVGWCYAVRKASAKHDQTCSRYKGGIFRFQLWPRWLDCSFSGTKMERRPKHSAAAFVEVSKVPDRIPSQASTSEMFDSSVRLVLVNIKLSSVDCCRCRYHCNIDANGTVCHRHRHSRGLVLRFVVLGLVFRRFGSRCVAFALEATRNRGRFVVAFRVVPKFRISAECGVVWLIQRPRRRNLVQHESRPSVWCRRAERRGSVRRCCLLQLRKPRRFYPCQRLSCVASMGFFRHMATPALKQRLAAPVPEDGLVADACKLCGAHVCTCFKQASSCQTLQGQCPNRAGTCVTRRNTIEEHMSGPSNMLSDSCGGVSKEMQAHLA